MVLSVTGMFGENILPTVDIGEIQDLIIEKNT